MHHTSLLIVSETRYAAFRLSNVYFRRMQSRSSGSGLDYCCGCRRGETHSGSHVSNYNSEYLYLTFDRNAINLAWANLQASFIYLCAWDPLLRHSEVRSNVAYSKSKLCSHYTWTLSSDRNHIPTLNEYICYPAQFKCKSSIRSTCTWYICAWFRCHDPFSIWPYLLIREDNMVQKIKSRTLFWRSVWLSTRMQPMRATTTACGFGKLGILLNHEFIRLWM